MSALLSRLLEAVRTGFWAIPLTCMALAAALAAFVTAIDAGALSRFDGAPSVSVGSSATGVLAAVDPDAARAVLSTVGAGILGVLGIAFSVTVTTLVLASQQFGPHVLRNYMDKRFVQCVLGLFAGTALYAFVSLHLSAPLLGDGGGGATATVLTALVLALVDLVMLVLFIHHTAVSLRVGSIITDVHDDLLERLDTLCPPRGPSDRPTREAWTRSRGTAFDTAPRSYRAPSSVYLQAIDREALLRFAREHDLAIRLRHSPGSHVLAGATLADVVAGGGPDIGGSSAAVTVSEEALARLFARHLALGSEPTPQQDASFALRQLVQIALRALSPALNDPFTAIACIDRLAAMLSALLERPPRGGWYADRDGVPRLLEPFDGHAESVAFAFDQIRVAAAGRSDVARHLTRTFEGLAERHPRPAVAALIERQRSRLAARLDADGELEADRADLAEGLRVPLAERCLESGSGSDSAVAAPLR